MISSIDGQQISEGMQLHNWSLWLQLLSVDNPRRKIVSNLKFENWFLYVFVRAFYSVDCVNAFYYLIRVEFHDGNVG